ncbi:MAG: ECF sigma factor [Bacteriophage sp.]|jgi:DNA-binding NarL/FixJ family response regulator|nr:MAG: ECF sigma factor [Bacteriophage sp.]UVX71396.1 MAG: ECF sigma factor [Bacteriophage sp.]UWI03279.1 MAG: ECF sigma factor [Bacteriophage sp.]
MRELLKSARIWMTESSRRSFYAVLQEAKITPRQMKICEMKFVDGKMNYQIAMELNISTKTVDREISTAYKAINRVLSK